MDIKSRIKGTDLNPVTENTNSLHFSLGGFVISLLIIFNFITPTAIIPRSLFISIFSLIPFILLLKRTKLKLKSFVFIGILLLITIVTRTFHNLLNIYFLLLFQLLVSEYKDGISFDRGNRILLLIGSFSLTVQLFYYSKTFVLDDGRTGLGTDPNFSGLIILLFFFYLRKVNWKIAMIPVIIAILVFQSRTLFISVVLFLILEYFSNAFINRFLHRILNPFRIILISNIIFFMLNAALVSVVTFQQNETSNILDRVFNIADKSNSGRLVANIFWSSKVLSGEYLIRSENLEEQKYDTDAIIMPHNSFLNLLITSTTFFGIIYLLYISYLLKPLINQSNIQYFYIFLFYSLFLHGLFDSIYLFPFLMTFLLKPIKPIEF